MSSISAVRGESPLPLAGPASHRLRELYQTANFRVLGEAEGVIDKFVEAWEAGAREGRVRGGEISGRRDQVADPPLRSPEIRRLSPHRRAVLSRLPVYLRVLRHHRALRSRAARQDQRPDARGTRRALPPGLSRPRRLRRRQPHRQQEGRQGIPSGARQVARSARLSVRVHDRSLAQSRRRSRAPDADEPRQFRRGLCRHRESRHRDADCDAQKAEHAAQHCPEHPQDLRRRSFCDTRASSSASTARRSRWRMPWSS